MMPERRFFVSPVGSLAHRTNGCFHAAGLSPAFLPLHPPRRPSCRHRRLLLLIPTPQSTLRVTFIEHAGTQFMTFRAIITGATGMVGEGVLLECLSHPAVEQILVINRKPGGLSHPKLREIIHADFFNLAPIESQLTGYD